MVRTFAADYFEEPILPGFNRIVAKGLVIAEPVLQGAQETDANTSNKKMRLVPYPCTVADRFECPY
jgi:hypothetical protein